MLRHGSFIIRRSQFHGGGGTHMYITIMVAIVLTCSMSDNRKYTLYRFTFN